MSKDILQMWNASPVDMKIKYGVKSLFLTLSSTESAWVYVLERGEMIIWFRWDQTCKWIIKGKN